MDLKCEACSQCSTIQTYLKILPLHCITLHWNDAEVLILNGTKAPSCDFSSPGQWPTAEEWMVKVGEGYYCLHSPSTHTTHMWVITTHKVQISFLPTKYKYSPTSHMRVIVKPNTDQPNTVSSYSSTHNLIVWRLLLPTYWSTQNCEILLE